MATRVKTLHEAIEMAIPALLSQYLREKDSTHVFAPFIEGPPGIGKSASISSLAKKLKIKKVIFISCGVIDPDLEFVGLSEIVRKRIDEIRKEENLSEDSKVFLAQATEIDLENNKKKILEIDSATKLITKWIKPERLAAFDDLEKNERGLLVFDDVHFLLERQQAMLMQLLTNAMTIHTHKIGSGNNVAVMFLANRMIDKAGAQELLAPVIDRVKRIVIDFDPILGAKDWVKWAENESEIHSAVVSFVKQQPEVFYTFEAEDSELEEDVSTAKFASPRGYEYLAREIEILEDLMKRSKAFELVKKALPEADVETVEYLSNVSRKILETSVSGLFNFSRGTIGEKAAREFAAYYEIFRRYELDKFLEKTEKDFKIKDEELAIAVSRFGYELARKLIDLELKIQDRILERLIEIRKKSLRELKQIFEISDEMIESAREYGLSEDILKSFTEQAIKELKKTNSIHDLSMEQKAKILYGFFVTKEYEKSAPAEVLPRLLEKANRLEDVFGPQFEKAVSRFIDQEIAREYVRFSRFVLNLSKAIERSNQSVQPLYAAFFGSLISTLRRYQAKYEKEERLIKLPVSQFNAKTFAEAVFEATRLNVKGLERFEEMVSDLSSFTQQKKSRFLK